MNSVGIDFQNFEEQVPKPVMSLKKSCPNQAGSTCQVIDSRRFLVCAVAEDAVDVRKDARNGSHVAQERNGWLTPVESVAVIDDD